MAGVALTPLAVGFIAALIVGYLSIKILLQVLSKGSFHKFAYYCWLAGAVAVASTMLP